MVCLGTSVVFVSIDISEALGGKTKSLVGLGLDSVDEVEDDGESIGMQVLRRSDSRLRLDESRSFKLDER